MNYGTGGTIDSHYDEGNKQLHRVGPGPRLATSMINLRSAVSGGRTVFPLLGLSVRQEALSLMFWYNLDSTGGPDTRSLHAGCPVVTGHKWILNKWINRNPHWDSHPCGRNRDHQDGFPPWATRQNVFSNCIL